MHWVQSLVKAQNQGHTKMNENISLLLEKQAFWKEVLGLVKTKRANKIIKQVGNQADDMIARSGYTRINHMPDKVTKSKFFDFLNVNNLTIPSVETVINRKPLSPLAGIFDPLRGMLNTKTETAAYRNLMKLHEAGEAASAATGKKLELFATPISGIPGVMGRLIGRVPIGRKKISSMVNTHLGSNSPVIFHPITGAMYSQTGVHAGLLPLSKELEALGKYGKYGVLNSVVNRMNKFRSRTGEYNYVKRVLGKDLAVQPLTKIDETFIKNFTPKFPIETTDGLGGITSLPVHWMQ